MANCNQCLYFDVCKFANEEFSTGTKVKDLITECKDFKDISTFINKQDLEKIIKQAEK